MKQPLYIILFLTTTFIFCQFARKQKEPYKEKDIVIWSESDKISWNDFKGKPPQSQHEAITSSTIYSKYEVSSSAKIAINIRACFILKESWKKVKNPSEYLLNHEQKHFDITEIYARRLRKTLTDTIFKNETLARREIPKIMRDNDKSLTVFQSLYDKETNHSINQKIQDFWNAKIERELTVLQDYKNSIVIVNIK